MWGASLGRRPKGSEWGEEPQELSGLSAQLGEPKAKEAEVPVKLGPPWAGLEEATTSTTAHCARQV